MPAKLNFVERPKVNDRLVEAVRTPGRQIVVYGESGSGKSSLVQKVLERLYPAHIVSRCTSATTYVDLIRDALDQMNQFYDNSVASKTGAKKATVGFDIKLLRSSFERQSGAEASITTRRVVAPEVTPQRLAHYMGQQGICWQIEDFHQTSPETKRELSETLKVFSDLAQEYPELKVIVIGAATTARELIQANSDMRNRLAELHVPLMYEDEVRGIVENGGRLLNMDFEPAAVDYVSMFSNGIPSIAHYLGLHACLDGGVEATSEDRLRLGLPNIRRAVELYVEEASDTLRDRFSSVLVVQARSHIDSPRLILAVLAAAKLEGLTEPEILDRVRTRYPSYTAPTLKRWLKKLREGGPEDLIYRSADGRYRFGEPVMHTYAQGLFGVDVDSDLAIRFSELLRSATANWATGRRYEFQGDDGLTYVIKASSGTDDPSSRQP